MATTQTSTGVGGGGSGGGVSNVTTAPGYGAPFLQPLGQQIGNQLSGLLCQPTNIAGLMPQIAGQNILQQGAAQTIANQAGLGNLQFNQTGQLTGATCGSGVAGYQQYLCAAQQNVGPNAYQQYMSPYQQQVIAPTLQQYDIQSQINKQALPAAAIQAGAYGGARCGVEQGVYQSQSDLNRAVLQAQLQQQGFNQAQQAANTAFGQYNTLGTQQQGYASNLANMLNTYGSTQQGYVQSILGAQQQGNKLAACYPLTQLQTAGGIFNQLTNTPGTPGQPLLTNPLYAGAQAASGILGNIGASGGGGGSGGGSTGINYASLLNSILGNAGSIGSGLGSIVSSIGCGIGSVLSGAGCVLGSIGSFLGFKEGGSVQVRPHYQNGGIAQIRPMFRKGGSVADGTGITYGLTNRRAHYAIGPTPSGTQQSDADLDSNTASDQYKMNYIPGALSQGLNVPPGIAQAYFKDIKNQIMPNQQDRVRTFLSNFGASGADVPMGAGQTLGNMIAKASEASNAQNFKIEQEADKYASEGALAGLRGISKQQNEANMLKARNLVTDPLWHPEIKDPSQRLNQAYLAVISPSLNPYKKDISPAAQKNQTVTKIAEGKTTAQDITKAGTDVDFEDWKKLVQSNPNVKPEIKNILDNLHQNYDIDDIPLTNATQGSETVKNVPQNQKNRFVNGKNYVQNGVIYQYNNGKLTAILDIHQNQKNYLNSTATKQ